MKYLGVGASKEAVSKEDAASFLRLRRVITRYEQVPCCTCFDDRSTEVSKTKVSLQAGRKMQSRVMKKNKLSGYRRLFQVLDTYYGNSVLPPYIRVGRSTVDANSADAYALRSFPAKKIRMSFPARRSECIEYR